MVILQFNKLIRNKWIWGVFAIAISLFFAFDFLVADLNDRSADGSGADVGTLAGKAVDAKRFQAIAEDMRGLGRNRDWKRKQSEVNRMAWESYATLAVAEKSGLEATDGEVQAMIRREQGFLQDGQFSFARYQALLAENGMTPERFEESLRRQATQMRVYQSVLGAAAWASPMELDQAVADMTDVFTVKVARFSQDKKAADAVKVDDAALRKWYDENTNSLALPERVKIRLVKFDATRKEFQAKVAVSEDKILECFDSMGDKFVTKDTNGVEKAKKFEDLTKAERDEVEGTARRIATVEYLETNLNHLAYAVKAAKGASRLDEIAKDYALKVETSDWFSTEGGYQEGFMKYAGSICPGAQGFGAAVAELDMESEDLRYAVVSAERAVWLIEKVATSPSHVPTFDEAKEAIRPRALRAAKADAFKASVEAIAKGGAKAVLAVKDISTNLTFSVSGLTQGEFPDQMAIARAAMSLKKGEVSEFTLTSTGRGLLVVCEDRKPGDAAKAMVLRSQVQNDVQMLQQRQIPEAWQKWNLERLGFVAGAAASVEDTAEEAE